MGWHRKIDVRVHGDAKYRALSSPPPCGKFLWFYLLTGPHTSSLPGLFHCGEAALAEALKWPLEGFREAFRELSNSGMVKADWEARVVWIPNAVRYNVPESPNVVKSWSNHWDLIPECELKDEASKGLKGFLKGLGEAFLKAFREACPHPSPNQEQEQEQEQQQQQANAVVEERLPESLPEEFAREYLDSQGDQIKNYEASLRSLLKEPKKWGFIWDDAGYWRPPKRPTKAKSADHFAKLTAKAEENQRRRESGQ